MTVEAGGVRALQVLPLSPTAQGDETDGFGARLLANQETGVVAVQPGHAQVEHGDVRAKPARLGDRGPTAMRWVIECARSASIAILGQVPMLVSFGVGADKGIECRYNPSRRSASTLPSVIPDIIKPQRAAALPSPHLLPKPHPQQCTAPDPARPLELPRHLDALSRNLLIEQLQLPRRIQ
jgi:hypothetical protein